MEENESEEVNYKSYMQAVKNRLKKNNYSKFQNTRIKSRYKLLKGSFSNLEVQTKIISDDETEFYNMVCEVINNCDEYPLKSLTDNKIYDKMSNLEKQRYVLNLSEKYNRLKNRYYKENIAI